MKLLNKQEAGHLDDGWHTLMRGLGTAFRVFVWGCLYLESGVDGVRRIERARVPHRSPASIFVQQQMFSNSG